MGRRPIDRALMAHADFVEFIRQADEIVRASRSEADLFRGLEPKLRSVLSRPEVVPPAAFAQRADRFSNNLIYAPSDGAFSMNGAVWLPGQTTPIHDHLTWALVGVISGEEREVIFRRTDDRSDPTRASLVEVSERVNRAGHITKLGHKGIHRIDNISETPTLSLHLYGADIGNVERHCYDPVTGAIGKFVSGYCNVLRDLD